MLVAAVLMEERNSWIHWMREQQPATKWVRGATCITLINYNFQLTFRAALNAMLYQAHSMCQLRIFSFTIFSQHRLAVGSLSIAVPSFTRYKNIHLKCLFFSITRTDRVRQCLTFSYNGIKKNHEKDQILIVFASLSNKLYWMNNFFAFFSIFKPFIESFFWLKFNLMLLINV